MQGASKLTVFSALEQQKPKPTIFAPAEASKGLRNPSFYAIASAGGFLACSLTHAAVVTLDIHKCRAQALGATGQWPGSLSQGVRKIIAEEGVAGLKTGWVPTLFGYGFQGLFKFGLNEFFKDFYGNMVGQENLTTTARKMALWAAASGSAEVFADIALCPFEMTKVKMQVSLPVNGVVAFPRSLGAAMGEMTANKAKTGFPFGSLGPLWGRQVPYTMIKFVGFYLTADWIYEQLEKRYQLNKSNMSQASQLTVTFAAGYWAGIFCALATQPMDNLVSMKGSAANAGKSFGQIAKEAGLVTLCTKGLFTRVVMIGTLTGLQWWVYGTFKSFFNLGTQ